MTTGLAQEPASRGTPAIGSEQDAELVLILTRSTLVGLHRANISGNYTVMRDLAAPSLKSHVTAADLSAIFAPLRQSGINLESVAVIEPRFDPPPFIDGDGRLKISGSVATRPQPIRFSLQFEVAKGSWLLSNIVVDPSDEPVSAPVPAPSQR